MYRNVTRDRCSIERVRADRPRHVSRVRCLVAVMAALVCAAALLVAPAPVGAAGLVPPPDADSFYSVPAHIANLPNGTVLASRSVLATALSVPIPARAWQVKYKTIDQVGHPSAFVTTLLVPNTPWRGTGARPLISYQVAVDALSTKCAPSYVMRAGLTAALTSGPTVLSSNAADETANITQAVLRGFAVAVPDWEGPRADWIGDSGDARGVLDGIRAVRNFARDGVTAQSPISLVGYSGGALATDWAIQMQPKYAPELHFIATALGGTPANIADAIAAFKANLGARAAIPLLLAALQRSYPKWHLDQYLSDAGRVAVANSQHDCLLDSLIRNAGVDPAIWEKSPGSLFDNPVLSNSIADISPVRYPGTPHTPILFYHAANDELAPIADMRQLARRDCREHRVVHIVTSPIGEHITYVLLGFPVALNYLAQRFAGKPPPNDC
ncbi:MAG: lipase family protein [Jatrophihabitans sp.]